LSFAGNTVVCEVVAGGFAVMLLGSPLPLLVLIVIGKIALDIHLHRREHRPRQEASKTDAFDIVKSAWFHTRMT
jgi:hypothetical protein